MKLVTIHDLSVKRSPTFQLCIQDLGVQSGEIICIAGPNGSGKTTLIECLTGLIQPDEGDVAVLGNPVDGNLKAVRANIGFIPDDEAWFIKELCAREYLDLVRHVYQQAGVATDMAARCEQLAQALYFTDFDLPLGSLSHGNKKKVQLIAGLMHRPAVIIVDELRNGLDPLAIIAAEDIIRGEAKRGACVIAATHDLWWAQRIARTLVLLLNGSIAMQAPVKALVKQYGSIEKLFLHTVRGANYAAV